MEYAAKKSPLLPYKSRKCNFLNSTNKIFSQAYPTFPAQGIDETCAKNVYSNGQTFDLIWEHKIRKD